MKTPKCSKCGRRLTNPESIARGMGPECAGVSGTGHRISVRLRSTRGHGHVYPVPSSKEQIPLWPVFSPDPDEPLEKGRGNAFPTQP